MNRYTIGGRIWREILRYVFKRSFRTERTIRTQESLRPLDPVGVLGVAFQMS
jgi:hypothetical protein